MPDKLRAGTRNGCRLRRSPKHRRSCESRGRMRIRVNYSQMVRER
ncbi:hypothetical protein [Azospirillum palustre]